MSFDVKMERKRPDRMVGDSIASKRAKESPDEEKSHRTLSFNIPRNPYIWSVNDVQQWLQWLQQHLGLPSIDFNQFNITGKELCGLDEKGFQEKSQEFVGDIIYAYLSKFKEGCNPQPKATSAVAADEALKQLGIPPSSLALYSPKEALAALSRGVRLQDTVQLSSPSNTQSLLPALIQNSGLQNYLSGGPTLAAWPPYNLAISPVYTNAQNAGKADILKDVTATGPADIPTPLLSQTLEQINQGKQLIKPDDRPVGKGRGRGRKASSQGRKKGQMSQQYPGRVEGMDSLSPSDQREDSLGQVKLTTADPVTLWPASVVSDLHGMEGLNVQSKIPNDLTLLNVANSTNISGSPQTSTAVHSSPIKTQPLFTPKRMVREMKKTMDFVHPSNPLVFDKSLELTDNMVNLMAILHEKIKFSHDSMGRVQGMGMEDTLQFQHRAGSPELWNFLLELLTNEQHYNIIRWVNKRGEFMLVDKEEVSKLWGKAKNKDDMNYDKLSRALRYYYESKYKSYKNFGIMQKGEEASIKYNYQFTEAGMAKLCHHIGWEQVRRYTTTPEQIQGLDILQNLYLQKMKSPVTGKGGSGAGRSPQAQKVLPAEVAGMVLNTPLNTAIKTEGGEVPVVVSAPITATTANDIQQTLTDAAAQAALEQAGGSGSGSVPPLFLNPALLQGMLVSGSNLVPPMSPATLQAITAAFSNATSQTSVVTQTSSAVTDETKVESLQVTLASGQESAKMVSQTATTSDTMETRKATAS